MKYINYILRSFWISSVLFIVFGGGAYIIAIIVSLPEKPTATQYSLVILGGLVITLQLLLQSWANTEQIKTEKRRIRSLYRARNSFTFEYVLEKLCGLSPTDYKTIRASLFLPSIENPDVLQMRSWHGIFGATERRTEYVMYNGIVGDVWAHKDIRTLVMHELRNKATKDRQWDDWHLNAIQRKITEQLEFIKGFPLLDANNEFMGVLSIDSAERVNYTNDVWMAFEYEIYQTIPLLTELVILERRDIARKS